MGSTDQQSALKTGLLVLVQAKSDCKDSMCLVERAKEAERSSPCTQVCDAVREQSRRWDRGQSRRVVVQSQRWSKEKAAGSWRIGPVVGGQG